MSCAATAAVVVEKLEGAFPVWKASFSELQKCVSGENYYKSADCDDRDASLLTTRY